MARKRSRSQSANQAPTPPNPVCSPVATQSTATNTHAASPLQSTQTWSQKWKENAPSNGFQKVNMIASIVLAFFSGALALLTFFQQADIKGMSDLLIKQDSSISFLKTLAAQSKMLANQNRELLVSQNHSLSLLTRQTISIQEQTKEELAATKPILRINPEIYLVTLPDPSASRIQIGIQNYGQRQAKNIQLRINWFLINDGKIQFKTRGGKNYPEPLDTQQITTYTFDFSNVAAAKMYFSKAYVVISVEYIDARTQNKEKNQIIAKMNLRNAMNDDYLILGRTVVLGKERVLIEKAIRTKQLLENNANNTIDVPLDTSIY
ncbi:hypothetical protein [Spirosoma foliorum]|uniref:Uncharacterized protein n=1 Tax=Spirosoma foliorum TaxID=2710596 RepID=A0A7G5H5E9_9BACT|nr:hypothetical protein [Spirosoma foliorum]QMW06341.1 hypothetical protein H3H32_16355 [Spirosoma foliorum]